MSKKMIALDIQNYSNGWKLVLVERNPILLGSSIGLFNQCIDITETDICKYYCKLHLLDNKLFGKSCKPVSYILNNSHSPLQLTEKQECCLFLMIRGKSIKTTAKILSVSPRTVECHIDAIKSKLLCQYKSELIEKVIDNGFLYYIPASMQRIKFENLI